MSKDYYFNRVQKPNPPLAPIVDERVVSYETPYVTFRKDQADDRIRAIAQAVRVKRAYRDIFRACEERLGKKPKSARYLFDDGYEFYDEEGRSVGRLTAKELDDYLVHTCEEEYVFQSERIAYGESDYAISLGGGIYTAQELLDEALRIIDEDERDDGFEHPEPVYHLIQCYLHAKRGEIIWIDVG